VARRSSPSDPEVLRKTLVLFLKDFESKLQSEDLRERVKALIPAFHALRDLGASLLPDIALEAARERILFYFRQYPFTVINGEELMVVSGIQEWARRLRELRVELGWNIVNGVTASQMEAQGDFRFDEINVSSMKPDDYVLLADAPDREAAYRWHIANRIRKKDMSVREKILEFLRENVGEAVSGEELRYIAKNKTEWARRVRELRTEHGWPVVTRNTGRPKLPIGYYLLEADRQSPPHDRHIPDPVRSAVLRRDGYKCCTCGWSHSEWNPSDPRFLELHHVTAHIDKGANTAENLISLCTVCHDLEHSK